MPLSYDTLLLTKNSEIVYAKKFQKKVYDLSKHTTDEKVQNDSITGDFIEAVPKELQELYSVATKNKDLQVIGKFANALSELAKESENKAMENFALTLLEKIDLFEIEEISRMLKEFGKSLEKLQKTSQKTL